jgi:CO/xanthine dehydrogenase FAD-binding subunit
MLRPFAYLAPDSLAEAIDFRRTHDNARFLAGGTALLLALERGQAAVETIIDLKHIEPLRGIEVTPEGALKIGALVTMGEIIKSNVVSSRVPVLTQTARLMATPQVRNLGTIGGNIASGLAAADLVTSLLALNASLHIATSHGEERVFLSDFMTRAALPSPQETGIISAIIVPLEEGRATYQKLMVRNAADVSLANVAVWVQASSGRIADVRIVGGGCDGRPARLHEAEAVLRNQTITARSIDDAALTATETAKQTGDYRASEAYRRRMVGVLTRRGLTQLLNPP